MAAILVALAGAAAIVAIAVVAARLLPPPRRRDRLVQDFVIDDPYTAWFNANSRCAMALQAWLDAAPAARSHAYRVYLATLQLEEAAAAKLELHAVAAA